MRICNNCGAQNGDEWAFCVKCGQKFDLNVNKRCSFCGAEMAPGAKFCTKCGGRQDLEETPAPVNVPSGNMYGTDMRNVEDFDKTVQMVRPINPEPLNPNPAGAYVNNANNAYGNNVNNVNNAYGNNVSNSYGGDVDNGYAEDEEYEDDEESGSGKGFVKPLIIILCVLIFLGAGAAAFYYFNDGFELPFGKEDSEEVEEDERKEEKKSEKDSDEEPTTKKKKKDEPTTEEKTTEEDTTEEETTEAPETTTEPEPELPAELRKYDGRLEEEDRDYIVTLEGADWFINYRSEPLFVEGNAAKDNVVGKIQCGTIVHVEYICDGTWAVYKLNGKYVFSSIYDMNDPTQDRIMMPLED